MLSIEWMLIFLLLGLFVGFLAGLMGVGGGGVLVPILISIFLDQEIFIEDKVVHMALGTAITCMIISSYSSLQAHHRKGAVLWRVVKAMSPGIIIGSFLATFIASYLSSRYISIVFAVIMTFVCCQMLFNRQPAPTRELAAPIVLFLVGIATGGIAALVAMGGAFITVAYLTWQNVDLKKAIGTSSAIGFPIAVVGTLGYLMNGWSYSSIENYTLGFIYLPAVVCISIGSFLMAPYGVRVAHALAVPILKKVFAVLVIGLSVKMVFTVFNG